MPKFFVTSDIHSYFDIFYDALISAGFDRNNPDHIFVSCGDLLDRGSDPLRCLRFVNLLPDNRKILIRGNHEDLLLDLFSRNFAKRVDIHNGTYDTAVALAYPEILEMNGERGLNFAATNPIWLQYINSCIDYFETKNHIFVHGWIPTELKHSTDSQYADCPKAFTPVTENYKSNWRTNSSEYDWYLARWHNGMQKWKDGIVEPDKTIVCGHWHCSWGNAYLHNDGKECFDTIETFHIDPVTGKQEPHVNWEPFRDKGIIALDACTAYSKKCNVVVIEDEFLENK